MSNNFRNFAAENLRRRDVSLLRGVDFNILKGVH